MRNTNIVDVALACFLILTWHVYGVGYMQGFVNYPTWRDMGPMMSNEDFMTLRKAHYWPIIPLAVIPGMIGLLLNLFLVFARPAGISPWLLTIVFFLSLGVAVATFAILIPLQDRIDQFGYDREVISGLIRWDWWLRKVPSFFMLPLFVAITWQAIRRARA